MENTQVKKLNQLRIMQKASKYNFKPDKVPIKILSRRNLTVEKTNIFEKRFNFVIDIAQKRRITRNIIKQ